MKKKISNKKVLEKPIFNEPYETEEDTLLIRDSINNIINSLNKDSNANQKKILEIGIGAGGIFLSLLKNNILKNTYFLGTDINIKAIKVVEKKIKENNINEILKKNNNHYELKISNLFSNINNNFDLIIFNPPYLPNDKEFFDPALHGGPKGNEIIISFLKKALFYLKKNGKIIILFSSLSKPEEIINLIKLYYNYKALSKKKVGLMEELYVFLLTPKNLFNKGKRGFIYINEKNNTLIKAVNPLSKINTISNEIKVLNFLNKKKFFFAPKLINSKNKINNYYLEREFIKGIEFIKFIESSNKKYIKKALLLLFLAAYKLDELKINIEELTRPLKNIIIVKEEINNFNIKKPEEILFIKNNYGLYLIDFDRSKLNINNPKNISQLITVLFSGKISFFLKKKGFKINKEKLILLIKEYKKDINKVNKKKLFINIIKEIIKS